MDQNIGINQDKLFDSAKDKFLDKTQDKPCGRCKRGMVIAIVVFVSVFCLAVCLLVSQ